MYTSTQISFSIITWVFVECDETCNPSWYSDIHKFVGTTGVFMTSGQDLYAETAGNVINNGPREILKIIKLQSIGLNDPKTCLTVRLRKRLQMIW